MSFASRDAFPARGGVGEDGERFPLGGGHELVAGTPVPATRPKAPYVELHAHSSYSFLDGASLPEELVAAEGEVLQGRLREGLRQVRAAVGAGGVSTVVEVAPWSRIPEARALLVPRDD